MNGLRRGGRRPRCGGVRLVGCLPHDYCSSNNRVFSFRYVSTRGEAPVLGFSDALLAGLARDGGLYVPEAWPQLDAATIEAFAGQPYHAVAQRVISPFVGDDLEPTTFASMVEAAYASFSHRAVPPLVQIADTLFVQELFQVRRSPSRTSRCSSSGG